MNSDKFVSDSLHKIKDRIATTPPPQDDGKPPESAPSTPSGTGLNAKFSSQQLTKALRGRREEFRKSRRDVIGRLTGFLARVPEDERGCEERLSKLRNSRESLERLLEEVRQLDDDAWNQTDYSSQLAKAMRVVENARLECIRSAAKLESPESREISGTRGTSPRSLDASKLGFGQLFKMGFAFSLPLLIVMAAAAALIAIVIIAAMSV